MKGFFLFVYRRDLIGTGTEGPTNTLPNIIVVDEKLPAIFPVRKGEPHFVIDYRNVGPTPHPFLRPANKRKEEVCFSGRYASTTDSRWGRPPMEIHDASTDYSPL